MYSRWFNFTVVALWLAAMTWLTWVKIIPRIREGEPPSYQTIAEAQRKNPVVGWKMLLGGKHLGTAVSEARLVDDGLTEIHSRVHFDSLPLRELLPAWLDAVLGLIDEQSLGDDLSMDTTSVLTIDPLGRLTDFESTLAMEPLDNSIKLRGSIEGTKLKMNVSMPGMSRSTEAYIPPNALITDSFSPQAQLPGLRQGQAWKVPVYSPLRPPNSPMEMYEASVEGIEVITWGGRGQQVWLVEYRRDSGFSISSRAKPQGRLWVRRDDGMVLKQQLLIMNSTLTFVRMTEQEAEENPLPEIEDL